MEMVVTVKKFGRGYRIYLNSEIVKAYQIQEEDQILVDVIKVVRNPINRGKEA